MGSNEESTRSLLKKLGDAVDATGAIVDHQRLPPNEASVLVYGYLRLLFMQKRSSSSRQVQEY